MAIRRKDAPANIAGEKKKYSVPFKKTVVQEYLVGLKSARDIFEEHGVRSYLLQQWLGWYHDHYIDKGTSLRSMKTDKTSDKARILGQEQELARLRAALEKERLRTAMLEHLVKLAKEHHGIDLKKSIGGK